MNQDPHPPRPSHARSDSLDSSLDASNGKVKSAHTPKKSDKSGPRDKTPTKYTTNESNVPVLEEVVGSPADAWDQEVPFNAAINHLRKGDVHHAVSTCFTYGSEDTLYVLQTKIDSQRNVLHLRMHHAKQ